MSNTKDVAKREPVRLPSDRASASPSSLGQATAVEQSRAVAEVQAAVLVAQQVPRQMARAVSRMEESCKVYELAARSSYRFGRGGQQVTGPSVHLARELARCFGNVQHGINELRRDDDAAISEMLAWAWDVETNVRSSLVFILPHRRDTKDGPKVLTDVRDVYENNANHGARRLRECIFAILPPWYTERAQEICHATLANGGGDKHKPMDQRRADMVKTFAEFGVTERDLVRKLGRGVDQWTVHDLATLTVIGGSLRRNEVSREDEFPSERITADDVAKSRPSTEAPAEGETK